MPISSELLLYRSAHLEPAQTVVAQVRFRQKYLFVALGLTGAPAAEDALLTQQVLRDALRQVCAPRRWTVVGVTTPASAPIVLLDAFSQCEDGDACVLMCSSRKAALQALALLNLMPFPAALAAEPGLLYDHLATVGLGPFCT